MPLFNSPLNRHIPHEEPIDLLNVAFENPRSLRAAENNLQEERAQRKRNKKEKKGGGSAPLINFQPVAVKGAKGLGEYDVPDRLSGLEEVEELRRLCPHRRWNFSLALALYFASRGKGQLSPTTITSYDEEYNCPAKVLLSGLGSDELLGGYSRHRHAYSRGGWAALIDEVRLLK
ncbi:hypothetical protein FRC10_008485 [Ceratobasidium sp. 414]|nr:hypothetical protein FRC10_008485 [Ceratobasidium sp. 414]